MELLKYETQNAPADSYPGQVKTFIKKVRQYRDEKSNADFKAAIPELLWMERELKQKAKECGEPNCDYFEEVIDALSAEKEDLQRFNSLLSRSAHAILSAMYDATFSISNFSYTLRKNEGVTWVEFYGYKTAAAEDSVLLITKDIFRSTCYQLNMMFIDMTLSK